MNWFTSILDKIFNLFRKGAKDFLTKYTPAAKAALEKAFITQITSGEPLHNWRDSAWELLNQTFNIDGSKPGNWITLLLSFAYEEIQSAKATKSS